MVSTKWQTRAMLAAQLRELSEYDVVSVPSVNEALRLIKLAGVDPALLIVDTGKRINREDVKRFLEAKRGTPLVLVVSVLRQAAFEALRDRCAAYLVRPVSIGRVAQAAVRVLNTKDPDPGG